MKLSVQVQCLLDNMAMELETCTNSLVWLMSNKTVNKTVYTFLSECTRKRFIFLHTGENELFISDKISDKKLHLLKSEKFCMIDNKLLVLWHILSTIFPTCHCCTFHLPSF